MYNKIDPVSLEIIWQRLVSIADEMDNSTIRTSFSTIVGESHDFGCVLMDEMGNGLSQAVWSPPQFCTMLPRTTRIIIEKFKKENFDLCILDVMMPFKDGFTLGKEIREKNENIPLFFLSAKTLKEFFISISNLNNGLNCSIKLILL